ncbi:MAG: iron complex outermembrane recepter protein [Thiomicrorhabdus sp.]|nr:MAG: iron complex outermembrane recepter protein [Thiomicrorhabdus sp.]
MTSFPKKKLSLTIFAVLATSSIAHAESTATVLDTVSVTDNTLDSLVSRTESTTLLQNSNSETGTALRQITGVEATRMGGFGLDLFINGQSSSQLNVLLDGAKIEGACPNRMDPPTAYADMSSFDSVTVIKGVNSVTYGSGGSGGTVLFERNAPTFSEGQSTKGEINIGSTSNGLKHDVNATLATGGEKGYMVVQASKKLAENYVDGNGNEINSSYESRQGHIDLGLMPDADTELRLSLEKTYIDNTLFQGASMDSPSSEGTTSRLSYKGENINDSISSMDVDLYSSNVDHVMDNYTLRTATGTLMRTLSKVLTKGAKIQLSSQIDNTTIDYGVQFESLDKASTSYNDTTNKSLYNLWPNVDSTTKSIFAEATTDLNVNQKLITGVRVDSVITDAKDATVATESAKVPKTLYAATYTDYTGSTSTSGTSLNALIRFEQNSTNNTKVFAGLSRTHRYPDATELYMANGGMMGAGQWIGNPDLEAEKHNQLDLGVSRTTNSASWSVSAFYDVVNDYILRDYAKNQTASVNITGENSIYLNIDARLFGLELSASRKSGQNLTTGATANLTQGINETDGRNLSNIAPVSGKLFIDYAQSTWNAGARLNYALAQTEVNVDFGELETPAWSTIDLYGNYQVNKRITLSAGVDNLTDHAYQSHLNQVDSYSGSTYKVYEAGRTVWAKMNATF